MKRRTQGVLLLPVMVVLVLFLDQVSKYLVATWLSEGQSWDVAPWLSLLFRITPVTNTGAAFGLFPKLGDVFMATAVVVIVAILAYYRRLSDGHELVRLALGLQMGGALGNLVDRLRQGFVVDFIHFNYWPMRNWPVFNLADSAIVAGVVLLALLMLWEEWCEWRGQPLVEGS